MTDLTEGQRLYAIGDVHGHRTLLRRDARAHSRGPRATAASGAAHRLPWRLCRPRAREPRGDRPADRPARLRLPASFLLGNHDSYVEEYLARPDWYDRTYHWLHPSMGGAATLASYGVPGASQSAPTATRAAFAAALPRDAPSVPERLRAVAAGGRLCVRACRDSSGRCDGGADPRRLHLDPRAVPDLDGGLRLQGGARPHHRRAGRAPAEPDRDGHRRRQGRAAELPGAGGRGGGVAGAWQAAQAARRRGAWRAAAGRDLAAGD